MHNPYDSEKIIIGACIRDRLSLYSILDRIGVADLQSDDMRTIYLCIRELVDQKKEVTLAKLADCYATKSHFSMQDSLSLIMQCYDLSYSFDMDHHAELIQNRAKLRRLQELGSKLANLRLDQDNAMELISKAKNEIAQLSSSSATRTVMTTSESMDSHGEGHSFEEMFKKRLEDANNGRDTMPGIPYKIPRLDEMTGGIRPGSLVLVGGRTSTGKTQFVLNLVRNWLDAGVAVGMFSMEMPLYQIDARLIAIKSGLDIDRVERPERGMDSSDVMKVMYAAKWHRGVRFCYDQSSALTPSQLKARAYYMQQVHGSKIIVVDFLTLMKSEKKTANAHEKFTEVIHELQSIAKETNVAIVVLAQLNRENAKAGNICPSLHHIRESGAIEESVDVAMLLHRLDAQDHLNKPGQVILNVDKNRHTGKRGHIALCFEKSSGRYYQDQDQGFKIVREQASEGDDDLDVFKRLA